MNKFSMLLTLSLLLPFIFCTAEGFSSKKFELGETKNVLFVLDASRQMGMRLHLQQESRLDAAKSIIKESIHLFPHSTNLGLRVYGIEGQFAQGQNSELVVPIGSGSSSEILKQLRQLKVSSDDSAPLTLTLKQAFESDLRNVDGSALVVLLSAGTESQSALEYIQVQKKLQSFPAKIVVLGLLERATENSVSAQIQRSPSFSSLLNKRHPPINSLMKIAESTSGAYYEPGKFDLFLKEIGGMKRGKEGG